MLFVVTGRSRDDVDAALDTEVLKSFALNASDEMFGRHGAEHPLGPGFSGAQDFLPHSIDEETALSLIDAVPPSLMRDICLNGTPDEIVEQVAEWRDCGVRYVVLANLSFLRRNLRKALPRSSRSTRSSDGSRGSDGARTSVTPRHRRSPRISDNIAVL